MPCLVWRKKKTDDLHTCNHLPNFDKQAFNWLTPVIPSKWRNIYLIIWLRLTWRLVCRMWAIDCGYKVCLLFDARHGVKKRCQIRHRIIQCLDNPMPCLASKSCQNLYPQSLTQLRLLSLHLYPAEWSLANFWKYFNDEDVSVMIVLCVLFK